MDIFFWYHCQEGKLVPPKSVIHWINWFTKDFFPSTVIFLHIFFSYIYIFFSFAFHALVNWHITWNHFFFIFNQGISAHNVTCFESRFLATRVNRLRLPRCPLPFSKDTIPPRRFSHGLAQDSFSFLLSRTRRRNHLWALSVTLEKYIYRVYLKYILDEVSWATKTAWRSERPFLHHILPAKDLPYTLRSQLYTGF